MGSTAIPAVSRTPETPQATSDLGPEDVSSSVLDALAQLDTTVVREEQKPPSERSVRTEYETNIVNARMTVVLFASLPGPPTSNDDPALARLPGRMQQILGEAVYLYGGHIVDPFGSRMIAEFEDASSAIQAARKGREDLESHNAGQSNRFLHIQARMVVHAGEARTGGGQVSGPVVNEAQEAAAALPPLVPAISATVLGLLGIHPDGPPIATAPEPFYNLPAETVEAVEPEPDMERTLVAPAKPAERRRTPLIIAAVGSLIVLLAIVGGGLAWMSAKKRAAALEARRQAASAAPKKIAAPAMTVRQIAVDPFWVEIADPKVAAPPAEAIRLAVIGILESSPELRVVDSPAGADKFGASIIQSPSGVELIPMRIAPQAERGRAVPFRDTAQASGMLARWISDRVSVAPPLFSNTSAETMELFARAVAEKRSAGSQVTPQLAALAKSLAKADPSFVPGQLLALDAFERQRIESDAIIAANAVLAVDPRNVAVRKRLAALQARSGQPGDALAQFVEVYKAQPGDVEAVQAIAIYALAANDRIVFDKMRALLEEMGAPRKLHTPDLLLVEGKIDQAATPLFELESAEPNNPALALKIGRVAVLRRMMSIADIELRKLRTLDPAFGYPMLHAYVLAERRDRANALVELERAISAARWDDLPYTRAAEVYAILGSAQGVIESLEKAVERGEPSGAYILNNPLFRFLSRDGRFVRLRARMDGQMKGVRAALATVPI